MPPKTRKYVKSKAQAPLTPLSEYEIVDKPVSEQPSTSATAQSAQDIKPHPTFDGVFIDADGNWEKNNNTKLWRVLGFDPSTKSGFAVMDYNRDTQEARLLSYGLLMVDTSKRCEGSYLNEYHRKMGDLLKKYKVDYCFCEHYYMSKLRNSPTVNGAAVNYFVRACVAMQCDSHKVEYVFFSSFIWKRKILENTVKATAKERKQMGNKFQKDIIKLALKNRWGIEFPEKMPSNKTKNYVNFVDDPVDASGMAIYGILTTHNPTNFTVLNHAVNVEYIN